MKFLDRGKILEFMKKRKDTLYDHLTRDFGGEYTHIRKNQHDELKYWKEAIERGEFDSTLEELLGFEEVYIIMTLTNEPVDFTFYTDKEVVERRVNELNGLSDLGIYWYITLYGNFRNEKNLVHSEKNLVHFEKK